MEKEYIRTRNGEIGVFKGYNKNPKSQWKYRIEFQNTKTNKYCAEEYILKRSLDIKELLQPGDIVIYSVNTMMTDIDIIKEHIDSRTQEKSLRVGIWSLEQIHIKQVATKEQFNSISYVLEE